MPEAEDFLPIFPDETEDAVLGRMLAWLNDGVPSGDPDWVDPREGGIARTLLVPAAREMATLYDRISVEFPAAASPLFAWGTYLDQWALVVGTERADATYAGGHVLFTAPEGTEITLGTEVGVDPDLLIEGADAPSYVTTEVAEVAVGETDVLVAVVAVEPGSFGNRPSGSLTFFLSEPPDALATVNNPDAIVGGTDEQTDEQLREEVLGIYSQQPGGGNVTDYEQWVRTVDGVGEVTIIPEGQGPGTVVVLAADHEGAPITGPKRIEIRDYLDPVAITVTPTSNTSSTLTVPSTAGFRAAGIFHLGVADLAHEGIHTYTGKTATQFTGVDPVPTMYSGDIVWQTGRGGGRAPVGHHIVVSQSLIFEVQLGATVELLPGYSLEPSSTAINIRPALNEAVRAYVNALGPEQEIVLYAIAREVMKVPGVHDLTLLRINGQPGNVTPPANDLPRLYERTDPPVPNWTGVAMP